jgi:hypothetical protein
MLRQRDHGSTGAKDSSLFARDGRDGGAKPFHVVKRNVGDDGEQRVDDVGSVEASSHTHLENGDVDFVFGKIEEGQGGEDLKVAGELRKLAAKKQLLTSIVHAEVEAGEVLVGNVLIANADAFIGTLEVGRGVEAGVRTCLRKD